MKENLFTNLNASVSSDRIVYTPSQFARSSLLYLQETGSLQALYPHTSSRSNLSSYLFFTVLSGEGTLVYDGVSYPLAVGSHVFIDCEKPYSHSTDDSLWSLQWCHFNGPEMKSIYNKYQARGGKPVFSSDAAYAPLLSSLYQTASSASYVRDMKINSLLADLLVLLMEDAWSPEQENLTEKQKEIRKVHDYLDEHYGEKILLDDLAAAFYIDKFYLCEQFKERYGVTVNDYLTSVRVTEAKKMLRFTDKTMDEIAESIGVNGGAYFSRLFKKVEGVSPGAFRKMW
jgi:AraC-like DNA-binding protein